MRLAIEWMETTRAAQVGFAMIEPVRASEPWR
jgi:hypothetical protein